MGELADMIFSVFEGIIALLVVILAFFALIYYGSGFVEERMKTVVKALKGYSIFVDCLLVLFIFSGFESYTTFAVCIANALWTFLLFTGFPFISLVRPDFLLAVACSVLAHFFLMLHFLESDDSTVTTVSYFLLFVWSLPIGIITSLSAVDDYAEDVKEDTASKSKTESAWNSVFKRLFERAEDVLPHTADKRE